MITSSPNTIEEVKASMKKNLLNQQILRRSSELSRECAHPMSIFAWVNFITLEKKWNFMDYTIKYGRETYYCGIRCQHSDQPIIKTRQLIIRGAWKKLEIMGKKPYPNSKIWEASCVFLHLTCFSLRFESPKLWLMQIPWNSFDSLALRSHFVTYRVRNILGMCS